MCPILDGYGVMSIFLIPVHTLVYAVRRWLKRYAAHDCIQGVSRLVDITAGGDSLGLCDQKFHINVCPILDGYGVMTVF